MLSSKLRFLLIVLCCTLQIAVLTNAACVCNAPGVDHCASCNEHTVVRPKPKPYETPLVLPPIGDNCWCNKLRVEPAALPKTCDKLKTPYCKCKSKPLYALPKPPPLAPLAYDAPVYNNPPLNYYAPPALPVYDSPPADPVSISLAVQAGKAIGVPEAKLAFGFVQKPLDDLPKIQFSNIPEENLFKLKSEVITLKKLPPAPPKPEEELLIEEDEDEPAGPYEEGVDLKVSYRQLGYQPEQFINPKFRTLLPAYAYAAPSYAAKPIYAKTKVDCGFKPGRIAPVYKEPKNDCAYKEY